MFELTRLTAILTSRFMMNLQEASQAASGSTGVSGNRSVSLVRFDRVVGSIGESLGPLSIVGGDTDLVDDVTGKSE